MFNQPEVPDSSKPPSPLRRLLPWIGVIVLVGISYDGAIFYTRWNSEQAGERLRAEKQAEQYRRTAELVGGDTLKILNFYAAPGAIRKGEHATLCYGVNAAKTVRLEPPVEEVWPALQHCLQVSPLKETAYKLIAEDSAGHSVSQ